MWSILACFGYEELPERLKGAGIHSIDNVMTLSFDAHDLFDALELWFEAIVSHFYYVIIETEVPYSIGREAQHLQGPRCQRFSSC